MTLITKKERSCLNCRFCARGFGTFICLIDSTKIYLQDFNPCDEWLQYGPDREKELMWEELRAKGMIK